jgi:hypothetical protein
MMDQSIKRATMLAALSANEKKNWFGIRVSKHVITDNTYDRVSHKKEHVAWHNAFYETRKMSRYKRLM